MKKVNGLLKSKVFWFNLVTGGLAIVNALNGSLIPTGAAAAIVTIGNIALRFLTDKPLDQK
jgi:hypothetical protein